MKYHSLGVLLTRNRGPNLGFNENSRLLTSRPVTSRWADLQAKKV